MPRNDPDAIERYQHTMRKKREQRKKANQNTTMAAITPTVVYEEYFDFNVFEMRLFTNKTAEEWAREVVEFARLPTTLKATEYFMHKGINYEEAMRLCDVYEVLDRAYKYAKYLVGNRREKGALNNELNVAIVHSSMAMYDPEWRAHAEWRAKLNQDSDKNKGNVSVIIERFPETSAVPEKIKEPSGE